MKDETQAGSAVPNVSSRAGRRFLRVVPASALGSPQRDLSHDITRPPLRTQKALKFYEHPPETPHKDTELIPFRAFEGVDPAGADEPRTTIVQARTLELAKADEALRKCLDGLSSVLEMDNVLGQLLAGMSRQLGAVSSTLRIRNPEQNTLPLELVFQDGRLMSPDEAKYPEKWRNVSLAEQRFKLFLNEPSAITHTLDPNSPIPDGHRSYLLGLGVKTILVLCLLSGGQVNGRLTFRFREERDFQAEELEIARALATQASLAIQLTQLAKTAKRSAVLEERNHLAGEIHDSLAQSFVGICMHLAVAAEGTQENSKEALSQIERARELARFGLSEARASVRSSGQPAEPPWWESRSAGVSKNHLMK